MLWIHGKDLWKTQKNIRKVYERFTSNLSSHIKSGRVKPHIGDSYHSLLELLNNINDDESKKYDVIYIDASHRAIDVLSDAVLSWKLLKIGGIMIFDDYKWKWSNKSYLTPKPAIDGFLASYESMYKIIHKDYQLHIQKISDSPLVTTLD